MKKVKLTAAQMVTSKWWDAREAVVKAAKDWYTKNPSPKLESRLFNAIDNLIKIEG